MGVFTQQQAIISVVNVSYNLRITQYFRLAAEDSFDVIRLPAKIMGWQCKWAGFRNRLAEAGTGNLIDII